MLMNIYLDSYFGQIASSININYVVLENDQFDYELDWIDKLPQNIDILGISFYTNQFEVHKKIIDLVKEKVKFLFVNFSEPTSAKLLSVFQNQNYTNVFLFSDVVINIKFPNIITNISWFISPVNPYYNNPAAEKILNSLTPIQSNRPYYFDCLLGRENANRTFVADRYQNSDLNDKFFYTYYKNDKTKFWPEWHEKICLGNRFIASDQLLPIYVYNNSYYSIVAETTFSNVYSQFTEKVAKPIIARRPFVAFCGRHYLKNLRSLGFQTFGRVIDESYDEIDDDQQRWEAAWKQVELLCQRSPERVYNNLRYNLDHNHQHFFTNDWHHQVKLLLFNHARMQQPH